MYFLITKCFTMQDYSKFTYDELKREEDKLNGKYNDMVDECAKEGLKWDEFQEKSHDIKESLYFISKYKRLNQSPVVEYGKRWKGRLIPLEEFKTLCENGSFEETDGYGYYATAEAKSDILISPSDILENIYRKDFTHVIWINN